MKINVTVPGYQAAIINLCEEMIKAAFGPNHTFNDGKILCIPASENSEVGSCHINVSLRIFDTGKWKFAGAGRRFVAHFDMMRHGGGIWTLMARTGTAPSLGYECSSERAEFDANDGRPLKIARNDFAK